MQIIRAALLFVVLASAAVAQDVTLTSRDRAVSVTGRFLGYDGLFFRIETEFGVLTVDGSGVVCDGPACPDIEHYVARVRLSGAPVLVQGLVPALLDDFAAHSGYDLARVTDGPRARYLFDDAATGQRVAEFDLHASSSGDGIAALLAEEADMALTLRPVLEAEARAGRAAGVGDLSDPRRGRVIALDALVPLVAASNPLDAISLTDLARAYAGRVGNWSALGGGEAPILLHLRDADAESVGGFAHVVMGPSGLPVSASVLRHATNGGLARAVATDPYALGIGSLSDSGGAKVLDLTGACGFRGEARVPLVKADDYPMTAPLFVYTPARRLPTIAREFLDHIRTPAAQGVIRAAGFVDQQMEEIPLRAEGLRLANAIAQAGEDVPLSELQRLVAAMRQSARLTVTFRFEGGTTRLDAHSRSNLGFLAKALETGAFDGRRLSFVGFSDGAGPAAGNLALSRRRAEAVRDAVLALAESFDPAYVEIVTDAFGEALPMACDTSDWGRGLNRRVEVWLR